MSDMNGQTFLRTLAILTGSALVSGGIVGYFSPRLSLPAGADLMAIVIAFLLALQGLHVLALTLFRRHLGSLLSGEEGRVASPRQNRQFRLQGSVLLLAALLLATPVAADVEGIAAGQMQTVIMGALVACGILQCWLNLQIWRTSDEFDRRLIMDTSAICFWLTQPPIFLWAAGERLGVLPVLDAWDIAVIIMAVYLLASTYVTLRYGASG